MTVHAIGINHIAFEVTDLDATLAFYERFFEMRLRGRRTNAWPSSISATSSSR